MPVAQPTKTRTARRSAGARVYRLVPEHCFVEVAIRAFGFGNLRANLAAAQGVLVIAGDVPVASWTRVDLLAESWRSNSPGRDREITGANVLFADEFPFIRFESTDITTHDSGRYLLQGDLYVRDVVGEVAFEARTTHRAGGLAFAARTVLSRRQFGLTGRRRLALSDAARVTVSAQFSKEEQR